MADLAVPLSNQDWADMGAHFAASKDWGKAFHCFKQVDDSGPERLVKQVQALINIGSMRALYEAEATCIRLEREWPNHQGSQWARGVLSMHVGHFDKALELFLAAHKQDEYETLYLTDAAMACQHLGDFEKAAKLYRTAIAANPLAAEIRTWYGMLLMLTGQHEDGWAMYEARGLHDHPIPHNGKPAWNGEALNGKTLAIYQEQGIGDAIQFVRFARLLKKVSFGAEKIIVVVRDPLYRLMRNVVGVDQVAIRGGAVPEYDYHIRMMSLGRVMHRVTFGGESDFFWTYINAQPIQRGSKFRVGLCWKGAQDNANDRYRSLEFDQIRPLLGIGGVEYVSLQQGHPFKDATIEKPPYTDILSLAQAVKSCDYVVSVDTATAHIAGAMSVRGCVLLAKLPDWRWGLTGDGTPWYPSLRLMRCQETLDWHPVIENAKEAIYAEMQRLQ